MRIVEAYEDPNDKMTHPAFACVEGDEMVRVVWRDGQGRRCTTFLTAQQIGEMHMGKDDTDHVAVPIEKGDQT